MSEVKELLLEEIDMSTVDEATFIEFMNSYNRNSSNLCLNPKKGNEKTQSMIGDLVDRDKDKDTDTDIDIREDYTHLQMLSRPGRLIKFIYLYYKNGKNYEIVAFARISINEKSSITTIDVLCSHRDKSLKMEKKPLGIFLLDSIYSEYVVNKNYILKLQPATPELKHYYTNWKSPSLPDKWYIAKTDGYLMYFADIDNVTDEQLEAMNNDVIRFKNICSRIKINPNVISTIPGNTNRKKRLTSEINKSTIIDDVAKKQQHLKLLDIDYFTADDIRDELKLEAKKLGGKFKTRNKKKKSKAKIKTNSSNKTKRKR
jgi:hypothetical protein